MITTDRMINVIKILQDKQKSFEKMQINMVKAVTKNLNPKLATYFHNELMVLPKFLHTFV